MKIRTKEVLILDLFCGGGGAGMGYSRAGFEVIGVDSANHAESFSHVGEFHQADWAAGLEKYGRHADFIHASPPCQDYSILTKGSRKENLGREALLDEGPRASRHPDLIGPVRKALTAIGKPYIMENVEGSPLRNAIMLCGWMFGYEIYRHRLFEAGGGASVSAPKHFPHEIRASRAGHHELGTFISVGGHFGPVALGREVMDAGWMTSAEIAESIPPYFTHWLGLQLLGRHEDFPRGGHGSEAERLVWSHVPCDADPGLPLLLFCLSILLG